MNTSQVLVIVVFHLAREAFNNQDVMAIGDLDFQQNGEGVFFRFAAVGCTCVWLIVHDTWLLIMYHQSSKIGSLRKLAHAVNRFLSCKN